jgi:alkylhydroperoxidase family enzyme
MLGFLEKVTLHHGELAPSDAQAVRAAANSEAEIDAALYVCYLFNIYDRCADALGWITQDEARYVRDAKFLLERGYAPGAARRREPPAETRRALERSVLGGPGLTAPALRRAAASGGDVPAGLAALVAKTRDHAYKVTDDDLADLGTRYSDDELFEVIVSAAVGASAARFDAAFAVLGARAPG